MNGTDNTFTIAEVHTCNAANDNGPENIHTAEVLLMTTKAYAYIDDIFAGDCDTFVVVEPANDNDIHDK